MDCVKICITGPESTGKSTLANTLAVHYKAPVVKEAARDFLIHLKRKYKFEDLEAIAKIQQKAIDIKKECSLVFCDTDLLTIKIWAEDKFHKSIGWVNETLKKNPPHLYLLCSPDLPWESDPLREDKDRLKIIFQKYLAEIKKSGIPYLIVSGKGQKRASHIISILDSSTLKGRL